MKTYEAVFDEDSIEGVYALSVVDDPAMEDFFIKLAKHPEEVKFSAIDQEKRLLLGATLIPNKKIYRNIDGNEFYMTFSEETIEKLAHAFLKNGNQKNSSLQHEIQLQDMSVVETWIVQDPNNDKSNVYGKTYEKGTWVAMVKVDNDDVWQKAKSGEINGFSIEALLGLTEVNFKTDIQMNKEDLKSFKDELIDSVKAIFNTTKEEVIEETVPTEVEVVAETVETEPSFDLEQFANDMKEIVANMSKEVKAEIDAVRVEFGTQKETLEKEVETLKTELSKTPEANPIVARPEVKVDFENMTNYQKMLYKRENI